MPGSAIDMPRRHAMAINIFDDVSTRSTDAPFCLYREAPISFYGLRCRARLPRLLPVLARTARHHHGPA